LKRVQKEAVVAYFKALSPNFTGGHEEKYSVKIVDIGYEIMLLNFSVLSCNAD
jgi:hypothetical protein